MKDLKEFYVVAKYIDTSIGKLYFVTVEEYVEFMEHTPMLLLQKSDVLTHYKKLSKMDDRYTVLVDFVENNNLFDIIMKFKNLNLGKELYDGFKKLFKYAYKEDVFDLIRNNEEFEYLRGLIKDINCVPNERENPNPEIARLDKLKRLIQRSKGEEITFESIYTSVWVEIGMCPDEITWYKLNKLFNRIAQFKNYNANVLFATVSDKVKIDPWYKSLDTNEEKVNYLNEKDLSKSQRNL